MRKILILLAIFAGYSLLYAHNPFDPLYEKIKPILYYLSIVTCIGGAILSIYSLWKEEKYTIKTGYKVLISVGISILSVICIPLVYFIYKILLIIIFFLVLILIAVFQFIFDLVKNI